MVRNCGCGKHGLTSFWTDHDKEWQRAHRAEAWTIVAEFRKRWPRDTERFARADAIVEKADA